MKKLYLLTTLALLAAGTVRAAELTAPFSFATTQENFDKCTVINVNGDDKQWKYNAFSNGTFNYPYSSTKDADDWLILPAADFAAGTYDLEFGYRTAGSDAESFAVFIGDAPTVENMTQEICRFEDVKNSSSFTPVSARFSVGEAGEKYIGFYCFSPKYRYNLYISGIEVKAVDGTLPAAATLDVEMEWLVAHVKVTLPATDVSGTAITGPVSLAIEVDDEPWTPADGAGTGAAGSSMSFDIELTSGMHSIAVTPSYELGGVVKTGERTVSDELKAERYYPVPMPLPATITPDAQDADHITFINVTDDQTTWDFFDPSYPSEHAKTLRYDYGNYNDANDWFIMPQMLTEAGGAFNLSFELYAQADRSNDLEIFWGAEPTPASMTNLIAALEGYAGSSAYEEQSFDFGVPQGSNIYIGVRCKSARGNGYIYIKNISLKETSGEAPAAPVFLGADFDGADGSISATAPLLNISGNALSGSMTLHLIVDGTEIASEECAPGAEVTFGNLTLDFGSHTAKLQATMTVAGDDGESSVLEGQTSVSKFIIAPVYTVPFAFAPTADMLPYMTIIDANADGKTWSSYKDNSTNESIIRCAYNSNLPMDDWAILPPVKIEKPGTYRLAFRARSDNGNYRESVEVTIGSGPTVAEQTRVLYTALEMPGVYESYEVDFEIAEAGRYYFGVHGISEADKSNLSFASLSLERLTVPVYAAPENLDAQINAARSEVTLAWSEPAYEDAELLGYNVYRNDVRLNDEPVGTTSYVDSDLAGAEGNPAYHVTAVYADEAEGSRESDASDKVTVMTTGIGAATAAPALNVAGSKGLLTITGAAGLHVRVLAITGATVAELTAASDSVGLPLTAGVYLVIADGHRAVKALVK